MGTRWYRSTGIGCCQIGVPGLQASSLDTLLISPSRSTNYIISSSSISSISSVFEPMRTLPVIKLVYPYGPMHDNCADVDGQDISFNLANFHISNSQLFCGHRCSDIGDDDSGDRNNTDQRGAHDGLGDQRCCWRRGDGVG